MEHNSGVAESFFKQNKFYFHLETLVIFNKTHIRLLSTEHSCIGHTIGVSFFKNDLNIYKGRRIVPERIFCLI